ncbi:MAG TPA: FAD-dependent monooxygenase [Gaiellaceae bacterium]|nr:FAD-dependent monooxygenase [Gaiellaceae bacterium]
MLRILISGGGIAGTTLAYWLRRGGFEPTVVERAGALRSSGNPVDVEGEAVAVAERMRLMPKLRAAATGATGLAFVDGGGRRVGRIDLEAIRRAGRSRRVELGRSDLAAILHEAAGSDADFRFGDSIASLDENGDGVEVAFERGAQERFDLVVGADGLHSRVRRLAFGPESRFVSHLGLYVASTPLDRTRGPGREIVMYNAPGRLATISPTRDGAVAFFAFRSGPLEVDLRDSASQKRVLSEVFARDRWRVPEVLERARAADDLYFDAVSQVTLDGWSTPRITLVGDAASSVSLFGGGSSLAMVAAFTLAEQLAADPGNPGEAFARYENRHRRLVEPRQRNVRVASRLLVPATGRGILLRNLAANLWPLAVAAGWTRRLRLPVTS